MNLTNTPLPSRLGQLGQSLLAALLVAGLAPRANAQSYSLSNVWSLLPATFNLDASANNRGLAYDVISNQVFVINKGSTPPVIDVFDGTTGSLIGAVNEGSGIISGGTFSVAKAGVADDGVFYGANLTTGITAASHYKLYRWADWNQPPVNVYVSGSDPVETNLLNRRIGDTFAITGGGTNTMILAGIGSSNYFALLSTTNGSNFTSTVLFAPGLPTPGSGVQFGLAFFTNNTFLVAPNSANKLYLLQFPTNFASLTSPVTATVLATNTLTGNFFDLGYNSTAGLLAVHGNSTAPVLLFTLPNANFASFTQVASSNLSFTTSQGINGNETGETLLGGTGRTNFIFTLDTSAGVQASAVIFTPAAVAPTITQNPVGGTIYPADPAFTLSVNASGSVPFTYKWQLNSTSNALTATNIPGATNGSYTLNFPSTNASGWYDVIVNNGGGSQTSAPVLLTVLSPVTSPLVSNLWSLAVGSRIYADNNNGSRGIAYDPSTTNVVVSDHLTTNIYVLDANTGADRFDYTNLAILGVTEGTFALNLVGIADDGVLYFANLDVPGDPAFDLYSFSGVVTNPTASQAFHGDPGNGSGDRWGDTMAIRGAGVNTQILLGSRSGVTVALLTTSDGINFSALQLTPPGVSAGFAGLGIAFGAGNTFWAKNFSFDLRQVSFDPTGATPAAVIQEYVSPTQIANGMTGIGVDATNNMLAGVVTTDNPNDLQLLLLTGTTNAPILFEQAFFPSFNVNGNNTAAVDIKNNRIYAINTDNGIIGLSYSVPSFLAPFSLTATFKTGVGLIISWPSVAGHSYQVQSRTDLTTGTWGNVGSPISASGTTTSFTNSSPGSPLFYQVGGQ